MNFVVALTRGVRRSLFVLLAATALANHPVLVEGEKDFDGDGRTGVAEDLDNATDRIFGTLGAALAAENGGANQNGRITIVTSGRFPEPLLITGASGNVTIEAVPGVEANIDAVLAGNAGSVERQGFAGIAVNAPSTRIITLRNLVVRNWTAGISVSGDSRVIIENCRVEHNLTFGIHVYENARALITGSSVTGSGFRVGNAPASTANPGIGVVFNDLATGMVANTVIAGSAAAGLSNNSGAMNAVAADRVTLFDNAPNMSGLIRTSEMR
jgi:parallel beta-helix repeat protein